MGFLNVLGKVALPSWLKWAGWALLISSVAGAFYYQQSVIAGKDAEIVRQAKEIEGERITSQILVQQFIEVTEQNRLNRETFDRYRTEQKELVSAVRLSHIEELERVRRQAQQLERINHVKPEDDGPVAPVLHDTLEWLRSETKRVSSAPDHNRSAGSET